MDDGGGDEVATIAVPREELDRARMQPPMPLPLEPLDEEESTRAVSREALFAGQDGHVVVGDGDDAVGDDATLAVAAGENEASNKHAAAYAQTMAADPGGGFAVPGSFPPPPFGSNPRSSSPHVGASMGWNEQAATRPQPWQPNEPPPPPQSASWAGNDPVMSPQQGAWGSNDAPQGAWGSNDAPPPSPWNPNEPLQNAPPPWRPNEPPRGGPWGANQAPQAQAPQGQWPGDATQPWPNEPAQQQPWNGGPGAGQGYDAMAMNPHMQGGFPQQGHGLAPHPTGQGMPGQMGGGPMQAPMTHPGQQQGQRPAAWTNSTVSSRRPKISGQVLLLAIVGVICLAIFVTGIVLFATTKF